MVEADFVDHVFVYHGKRLVSRGAILACIVTHLPPFERLSHCNNCNIRNASPTIIAYHRHISRHDPTAPTSTAATVSTTATTTTSTTATTTTSTRAPTLVPLPTTIVRAPGRLISTGAAAAQPEAPARVEPTDEPRPQSAPPSEAGSGVAERSDDDDDSDKANDDVQVEKVATDVATYCNIVHDDWYDTIAYDTFAQRPMPGVHFQVTFFGEVCSRGNLPTRCRQLFVQLHVGAGDYVVTDDEGRVITNLDIRPHPLSPEYFAQYFRPTEPLATYEYEATLMTTTRSPAVAVYVAYFGEIDSGSYRLASFGDRRSEGCIFIKPIAPKFNASPSVSVFLFLFPLLVLSLTLVRLAICCLYVFTVRYFSHHHVAFT